MGGRPVSVEGGRSGLLGPGLVAKDRDQGPRLRWTSVRWGVIQYLSLKGLESLMMRLQVMSECQKWDRILVNPR